MDHDRTLQATASASLTNMAPSQTSDETATYPEHTQILGHQPGSGEIRGVSGRDARPLSSSTEHHLLSPESSHLADPRSHDNPSTNSEHVPAPPPRRRDGYARVPSRRHTFSSSAGPPGIEWIVPVEEKLTRRTVGDRLRPTIENAVKERDTYARKALWTGYALNIAIGLQVFLGALTTGLAAALTNPRKAQVSTAILGGLATLVASYLARARGSGEPELSITRVKDLEHFLRECRAFQIDHAHEYSTPENGLGVRLDELRQKFEELLGNGSGERKLSPVGITPTQAV